MAEASPFESALAKLSRAAVQWEHPLRGCTNDEIVQLERLFDSSLPETYRAFRSALGKSSGEFLRGSDFLLKHLSRDLKRGAQEMLEDEGEPQLPPHAFVFLMHQGYQFFYFHCGVDPDPPVYYFREREGTRKVAESFTQWFATMVDDELAAQ